MKVAFVKSPTTALAGTGRGVELPAGAYKIVNIDGAIARSEVFVSGPDDELVCVNLGDPAVAIEDRPDGWLWDQRERVVNVALIAERLDG